MNKQPASAEPLCVGIVGAGKMARHHARSIARLPGLARVSAVVDPEPAALDAMRAIAPEAAGYNDLAAMLRAGRPDIVHIVTPPATHFALARAALEAGCHIYVEKPFVERAAEAEALLALAASRRLQVCAGHQLLFEPPMRVVRQYLPAIGRLVHVESYFSFRSVRRTPDGRTPLRADLQLLDILPHPVYLLLAALDAVPDGTAQLLRIEVGPAGTVHALVRRGGLTSALTVTLEGRPVESYLRLIGTNGTLHADFVRGTVQRQLGPGTSGIDKLLAPYRIARQLLGGTTGAMARRFLGRQRSYPGLVELFEAFYGSVRGQSQAPVSPTNLLGTVQICEKVAEELEAFAERIRPDPAPGTGPRVVLTGGTGFLGKALARALVRRGQCVLVLARRAPPAWEQVPGVEYAVADLGGPLPADLFAGASLVVHAAAETAGGWEQHQRNSIDATGHVLRAAAQAGIGRVVFVGSVAVLARPAGGAPVRDDTPLEPDSRGSGPYVWGKLESERLALALGRELGLEVKVARPGAIVDYAEFDPPGRLGKRVGNIFVAVGSPAHRLGVVGLEYCADAIAWMAERFEDAPAVVNLLDPVSPAKRDLVQRLREQNPDVSVLWLPTLLLHPLSWGAMLLQKALRPGKPAINVAKVFSVQAMDTAGSAALAGRMRAAERLSTVEL